jgi:aminoglycoside phosphotransferase (APT) family kinase protein
MATISSPLVLFKLRFSSDLTDNHEEKEHTEMTKTWKPAIQVNQTLVREILTEQVPNIALNELLYIGSGWDHSIWRADHLVFRFPHCTESLHTAQNIYEAQTQLARRLPIPIPTPVVRGTPTDRYLGHFVGYRWLNGHLPASLPLSVDDRTRLTEPLARTLHSLHQIPRAKAEEWGLRVSSDRHGELEERFHYACKRAEQLKDTSYAALANRAVAVMRDIPKEVTPSGVRLVHGDLHAGQILLGDDHRLAAILDWDELSIWDPAYDLMVVYSMIPPQCRAQFWELYGAFPHPERARFIALSYGLAILAQAVDTSQTALINETAFGLSNALRTQ